MQVECGRSINISRSDDIYIYVFYYSRRLSLIAPGASLALKGADRVQALISIDLRDIYTEGSHQLSIIRTETSTALPCLCSRGVRCLQASAYSSPHLGVFVHLNRVYNMRPILPRWRMPRPAQDIRSSTVCTMY